MLPSHTYSGLIVWWLWFYTDLMFERDGCPPWASVPIREVLSRLWDEMFEALSDDQLYENVKLEIKHKNSTDLIVWPQKP